MLTRGASMQQRMLEAIRRHFRDYGGAPSLSELAIAVGIDRTAVWRVLRDLAAGGHIQLQRGVARGIVLPNRADMLSDTELQLAALARGLPWGAIRPSMTPLATAFPAVEETDCSLPVNLLLAQIDDAAVGSEHGSGAGISKD